MIMNAAEVDPSAAAVVALKATAQAKSRLGSVPDPVRRRLAWTMAVDTLAALSAAVGHVVVVSLQPALASRLARAGLDVEVVPEGRTRGLNGSLALGAEVARTAGFDTVLACVGDLPALRPDSVRRVLDAAGGFPRSALADSTGVGTTMLIARGADLQPRFQGRSAAAHHSSGATLLTGESLSDARRDVDTEVDLADATRLGLGHSTGPLVDLATGRLWTYVVVTTTQWTSEDGTPVAVTSSGHRVRLPTAALADGLRTPRLGQRLHAVLAADGIQSAWL